MLINIPLRFIDPDGMAVEQVVGGWRFTGADAEELFKSVEATIRKSHQKEFDAIDNLKSINAVLDTTMLQQIV
jgi:hypothetical protein